ncbi:TlpA disulfide reductase family protein [Macrococcus capreoli]|uniref:TlpA family protein disulfide reductase n=1 Tax=Macrococcus capreoli TaxID=2982690 RepID=UPI0021D5F421|nr:TlpA disulfide reductase family protein [Macrococcus sp. TMW 2.2395]MCU7556312.1 TlpA family protein disulfide reductase [Macrococcus sp. TMW 2.2395]
MKHIITAILLLIFLLLAGYSIYQVTQFNQTPDDNQPVETHQHPINNQNIGDVTIENLKGEKLKLKTQLKHDITVINVWASWCGPCNEEMPELVKFDQEKPNHIGLLGMNVQDEPHKRDAFIQKYHAQYPMIMLDEKQMKQYKIYNIPTTLFVNKEGKVLKTYVGELNSSKLNIILKEFK